MAIYDFMRFALLPNALRKTELYRGVKAYPVSIGHLRAIEFLNPDGVKSLADVGVLSLSLQFKDGGLAKILGMSPKALKRNLRKYAPRADGECLKVIELFSNVWKTPSKFTSVDDKKATCTEFASTSSMRLIIRLAGISGAKYITGKNINEVPVQDALAMIIASEECNGEHYLSADTEEKINGVK